MDYQAELAKTKIDPKFAQLGYKEQTEVRDFLFKKAQAEDPSFKTMNSTDLTSLYQYSVFAPPVLEDKQYQQTLSGLMKQVDIDKNPQAIAAYHGVYGFMKESNGSLMGLLAKGATQLSNATGGRNITTTWPDGTPKSQADIAGQSLLTAVGSGDESKIYQYLNTRETLFPETKMNGNISTLIDIGNVAADIIGTGGLANAASKGIGTTIAAVRGGEVAAASMPSVAQVIANSKTIKDAVSVATRAGEKTFLGTVAPAIIESVAVTGPTGLLAGVIQSEANKTPETSPFASVENFALNYGMGVGADALTSYVFKKLTAASLQGGKGIFKSMAKYGQVEDANVPLDQRIQNVGQGAYGSPELSANNMQYISDLETHGKLLSTIRDKPFSQVTEPEKLMLSAAITTPDIYMVPTREGGFRVWKKTNPSETTSVTVQSTSVSNLLEAKDLIAREIQRTPERFNGILDQSILRAKVQQYTPWLENWISSYNQAAKQTDLNILRNNQIASKANRVSVDNRPYMGMNEMNNLEGAVVPVRMDLTNERLTKLTNGKEAFNYDDIKPYNVHTEPNAYLLTNKVKDLPSTDYESNPLSAVSRAREEGFDTLRILDDTGSPIAYAALSPNNIKLTVPKVELASGKVLAGKMKQAFVPRTDTGLTLNIHENLSRVLKPSELVGKPEQLFRWAATAFQGRLDPTHVSLYVKALLANDNVPIRTKLDPTAKTISVEVKDGTVNIVAPADLRSATDTRKFIQDLTVKLRLLNDPSVKLSQGSTIDSILSRADATPANSTVYKLLEEGNANNKMMTAAWFNNILQKELGVTLRETSEGFTVTIGDRAITGSLGKIYQELAPHLIPKKAIADELATNGLKLTKKGDQFMVRDTNGKVTTFNSTADIVQAYGISTNLLPSKYRPNVVEYDPHTNAVTLINEQGTVSLNKKESLDLLNSFARDEQIEKISLIRGKDKVNVVLETKSSIELIDHDTNSRMFFATVDEAKAFAKTAGTIEGLTELAKTRGLQLHYANGKYRVFTGEGNMVYTANTLDQVKQVMRDYPSKNLNATEMFPEAQQVLDMLPPDLVRQWKAYSPDFSVQKRVDLFENFEPSAYKHRMGGFLDTTRAVLGKLTKSGQLAPALQKVTNQIINAYNAFFGHAGRVQSIVDDIFKINGKMIKKDRRNVITYHLGADDAHIVKVQKDHPLQPGEQDIINRLQELYGKIKETGQTGLSSLFNISLNQHVSAYSHRIRSDVLSNPSLLKELKSATTSKDFMDAYARKFGDENINVKNMRNTFEYSRVADLDQAIFETDAHKIVSSYLFNGLRKFHMDVPSQEFRSVINQAFNEGKIPKPQGEANPIGDFLTNLHNVTMGQVPQTRGETFIKQTGRAIYTTMGKALYGVSRNPYFKSEEFIRGGERLLDNYMSMSYVTLLGMRPMTALRNVASIYLTTGTTFGVRNVVRASDWIAKHERTTLAEVVNRNRSSNLLGQAPSYMDEVTVGKLTKKATDIALKMFKNADEYTRMVNYATAMLKFSDGYTDFRNSAVKNNISLLRTTSRLDMFQKYDPNFVKEIEDVITAQPRSKFNEDTLSFDNPELQAKAHMFASRMNELNAFTYSAWNKPQLFQSGIIGKVAGQLGMFSASYRNYLGTAIANLDPMEKVAFFGNFIAVNLAFYSAFQLAQIKTNDFIPFLPGLPTASPTLEVLIDVLRAVNPTQSGDAGRQKLGRDFSFVTKAIRSNGLYSWQEDAFNLPKILPGSMQLHYARKMMEYVEKGDYWRAALSGLTASVESDWQDDLTVKAFGQQAVIPQATPSFFARKLAEKATQLRTTQAPQ